MAGTCARAVALGLPAVAFTEHVDHTVWTVRAGELDEYEHLRALSTPAGTLTPPTFDLSGYLESIARCREQFPDLRIVSGAEIGEPHWHSAAVTDLLAAGRLDRVLGSLHCLPVGAGFAEVDAGFRERPAGDVMRDYLAEIIRLIEGSDGFAVLAHIDYPVRHWPASAGPFDLAMFEEEYRHALRTLADSGRALEVNTRVPLHPHIVGWWREEGGDAVTFGSDAHEPLALARGLPEAAAMAEAHGFRPGRHVHDSWRRSG